jgi:uncharacterized membrane protein
MQKQISTGIALIILGVVLVMITNHGTRSSMVGEVAGVLFMVAGVVRIIRGARAPKSSPGVTPPDR